MWNKNSNPKLKIKKYFINMSFKILKIYNFDKIIKVKKKVFVKHKINSNFQITLVWFCQIIIIAKKEIVTEIDVGVVQVPT